MSSFPVKSVTVNDPTFHVLGGLSLLVVLFVLYLGGWRFITGSILGIVNLAITGALLVALVLAANEYWQCLYGPLYRRTGHLGWAVIMTASVILIGIFLGLLNDGSNPVGRFLKGLKPEKYR